MKLILLILNLYRIIFYNAIFKFINKKLEEIMDFLDNIKYINFISIILILKF